MPAEGKTPLTAEQVEILRWWVGAGAPRATTVGALGVPATVDALLAAQLGLPLRGLPRVVNGASLSAATPAAGSAAPDPQLVTHLFAAGFLVRPISQSDAGLVVGVNSPGTELGAAALAALAAAAPAIVDLNLADTALADAGLAAIGALPAATHLRLARNRLTDASLSALARGSPRLQYLNLYGNPGISDAAVETLGSIATLREVYLWHTGVSADAAARLRARNPALVVDVGSFVPLAAGAGG
jgi:hypothetical protein